MATTFYLRDTTATGVVPNAKQSADTITDDFATSYATYAAPADMLTTAGTGTFSNAGTGTGGETQHYSHYGTWVSPTLAAQDISGTVTIGLSMIEGNAKQNNYPRVKIYRWTAADAKGTDLLLATSATECPNTTTYALNTYWTTQAITTVTFAVGDRLVIEIEDYNTVTPTEATNRAHGIQFGGAAAGTYGSYITFNTVTITFSGTSTPKALVATSVGSANIDRKVAKNSLNATSTGLAVIARVTSHLKTLAATSTGLAVISRITSFLKTLVATSTGLAVVSYSNYHGSYQWSYGQPFDTIFNAVEWSYGQPLGKEQGVQTFYKTLVATSVGLGEIVKDITKTLVGTSVGLSVIAKITSFNRTYVSTSVVLGGIDKQTQKVLEVASIASANISRVRAYLRTFTATSVGLGDISKSITKTLSATSIGLAVVDYGLLFYRTFNAVSVGLADISRQVEKILDVTSAGLAIQTRITSFKKTLVATSVGLAVIGRVTAHFKNLAVASVGLANIVYGRLIYRTFTATSVGLADITREVGKVLDGATIALGSISRLSSFKKSLSVGSTGLADIKRDITKSLSVATVVLGDISYLKFKMKALAATSTALAVLVRQSSHFKTLVSSTVALADIDRVTIYSKILTAVSVGLADIKRDMGKVLIATSTVLGGISYIKVKLKTLIATSVVLGGIDKQISKFPHVASVALGTITRLTSFYRTYTTSTVVLTDISRQVGKVLDVSTVVLGGILRTRVMFKTLVATSVGLANITRVTSHFKILSATSVVLGEIVKSISKTLGIASIVNAVSTRIVEGELINDYTINRDLRYGIFGEIFETLTTDGLYTVLTWADAGSTTWKVPIGVNSVRYFIAGGGGGGGKGSTYGGGEGGDAGSTVTGTITVIPGENLDIIVGAPGAGGTVSAGSAGTLSKFFVTTAAGGAGGLGGSGYGDGANGLGNGTVTDIRGTPEIFATGGLGGDGTTATSTIKQLNARYQLRVKRLKQLNLQYRLKSTVYGSGANDTGNPIGGGPGYNDIILQTDPRVGGRIATTAAQLRTYLTTATAGQAVFVPTGTSINLSNQSAITINPGVILCSDRGYSGRAGGLIYRDDSTAPTYGTLLMGGNNIRITGIQFRGPHMLYPYDYGNNVKAGIASVNRTGTVVDNCEILGWSYAGIWLVGDTGGWTAHIHHNKIHHCCSVDSGGGGYGYGILQNFGNCLIEANDFDYCRHATIFEGCEGEIGEWRFNNYGTHGVNPVVDCHTDCGMWYKGGTSGSTYRVHHNTILYTGSYSWNVYGTPAVGCYFYNNIVQMGMRAYSGTTLRLYMYDNYVMSSSCPDKLCPGWNGYIG